jgi:hypothetical protein
MRRSVRFAFAMALAVVLVASVALAADTKPTTLTGKIACEMCILKHKEAKGCNNVFVADEGGKSVEYKLADTPALKEYQHGACEKSIAVRITGTVSGSGATKTLTAEKVEKI